MVVRQRRAVGSQVVYWVAVLHLAATSLGALGCSDSSSRDRHPGSTWDNGDEAKPDGGSEGNGEGYDDGGTTPIGGTTCQAGATQQCYCLDGQSGVQRCSSDGARWEPCVCQSQPDPGNGGSNPGDEEPVAVCQPGATQGCYCLDGRRGDQRCASDGLRWEACVCQAQPDPDPDPGAPVEQGRVTGRLYYDIRYPEMNSQGDIVLGAPQPIPASGVLEMIVIDAQGEVIGADSLIDDQGRFSIPVYQPLTGNEFLIFVPALFDDDDILFAVLEPERGGAPQPNGNHEPWMWVAHVDRSGAVGDLHITEELGAGALFIYTINVAGLVTVLQYVEGLAASDIVSLAVLWAPGLAWECGACYGPGYGQRWAGSDIWFNDSIWIPGDHGDSGAWGYPVLLHELGHYVARNYSRDDSPGGAHYMGVPVSPPFAWSEGWASFMAVMTISLWNGEPNPFFWDIQQGGSFWTNYETASYSTGSLVFPDPNAGMLQDLDENYVTAVLWHLWVGQDIGRYNPQYPVALGTQRVMQGITSSRFLHRDRGHQGADLVDFLDAVLCADGRLASPVNDMLWNYLGFPYDGSPTCN